MKKQTKPNIGAQFLQGTFYLLLLVAFCVIPFALGQRSPPKLRGAEPAAAAAPSTLPINQSDLRRRTLNPALMPWTVVASYPETVQSLAVASDDSYVYSAGGALSLVPTIGFYRYDPVINLWIPLPTLPQALFNAGAVYAANVNKIYVFGGQDASQDVLNTTYIYDIATNSWTTGTSMPNGRYFASVAYSSTGKIYVIGGFDPFFEEASQTWEYDPVLDTWNTSKTDIPVTMAGSATSIVDQFIYLAGSYGFDGTGTDLHYRYDIEQDSWAAVAPVPVPVFAAAGAAVGSDTYLIGGGNPSLGPFATKQHRIAASMRAPTVSYSTTYIYDTTTDSWTTGPSTTVAHASAGGTAIGDMLIVVAGWDGSAEIRTVEVAHTAATPTPSPTPSPSPSPTATPTATATATATPTPTPTPPPPTPTATAIATATPTATATATATPTATPTASPTPGNACYRQMTVNHALVPSMQSNFTVLVSVTDATLKTISNGGHVANANGYDIGFYSDAAGTTKLKWEVERYNAATGELIAWVKIPTLSSTTDTTFYLFYGDSTITTNQSDPVNTWDTNYKAVYHLKDGTTLNITDSTGGNNGTFGANHPTAVTGEIDGGAGFSTNQTINMGTPTDFPVNTAWTAEAWANPVATGSLAVMAWGQRVTNSGVQIGANGTGGTWRLSLFGGVTCDGGTVSTGIWQHLVGTFDGSSLRLYKNGSLVAGPKSASPTTSASPGGWIGSFSGLQFFNGDIDEVRISTTNRSADWIAAEYNNQNSPGTFITMGTESCPSPTPTPTVTP